MIRLGLTQPDIPVVVVICVFFMFGKQSGKNYHESVGRKVGTETADFEQIDTRAITRLHWPYLYCLPSECKIIS